MKYADMPNTSPENTPNAAHWPTSHGVRPPRALIEAPPVTMMMKNTPAEEAKSILHECAQQTEQRSQRCSEAKPPHSAATIDMPPDHVANCIPRHDPSGQQRAGYQNVAPPRAVRLPFPVDDRENSGGQQQHVLFVPQCEADQPGNVQSQSGAQSPGHRGAEECIVVKRVHGWGCWALALNNHCCVHSHKQPSPVSRALFT